MYTFTHTSKVAKVDDAGNTVLENGKKVMVPVQTEGVTVPLTREDILSLLDDPTWMKPTKVKLGGTVVQCVRLAKLVADSIKLEVNGKATSKMRQGKGIDVQDILLRRMVLDPTFATEWRDRWIKANAGSKEDKRALAEDWLASQEDTDDNTDGE